MLDLVGLSGRGDDKVDGGAGSDKVYAGSGNDVGVYNVTENVGSKDYYNGGHGNDHLELKMTSAEYNSEAVQTDLARFQAFLDGNGHGWGHHARSFKFEAFDLKVKSWESFSVTVTDPGENEAPVANDDAVSVDVGTIADSDLGNPSSNDSLAAAQVIDRSSFQIGPTADVENDALPRVSIQGEIVPATDVDIYAFELVDGEVLVLDIDYGVAGAMVDTQLFVMDANGMVLADNDTASGALGGAGSAPPLGSFDAFLKFEAPADGTYYVAVTSHDNDPPFNGGAGVTTGDYVLNVSIEGSTDPYLGAFVIPAADLLGNDTDAENDALTIISVGNGINTSVLEVTPSGDVLFKPASEHAASFEYTISDGNGGVSTAIAAVNGNTLLATPGSNDTPGNDLYTGSDGGDTFTFGDDLGVDADTIPDFTVGTDYLTFADSVGLAADPTSVHPDGTVVNFDNGDSVLLVGVSVTDDTVGDLFAP